MATAINVGDQTSCCVTAGNFSGLSGIGGCLISANLTARVEIIKECGVGTEGDVIFGPTVGSLSVSAYANGSVIHKDCPGRAGVSIPWSRHQGCNIAGSTDSGVFFIKSGSGSAFVAGNVDGLASIIKGTNRQYPSISISSQGGPSSLGTVIVQTDGAGLSYSGQPIGFNSATNSLVYDFSVSYDGGIINEWYLSNFSLELNPGEMAIANYTFNFYIDD